MSKQKTEVKEQEQKTKKADIAEESKVFSKKALLNSNEFKDKKDLLNILLDDGEFYNKEDVYSIIKNYLKRSGF